MEETRNWLEMPEEIMGGMILQRLGAVEILNNAQKVCRNWRRICKDPAMWKVIEIIQPSYDHHYDASEDFANLSKEAVNRSCGELIDITLKFFITDDLLDHISRSSSKLKRVCLRGCYYITRWGLINAFGRLPHLETLELLYISIYAKDIDAIGRNCPHLKSFKMKTEFEDNDLHVHAIANSMPALRHLKLVGIMGGDDGVRAILNGCPHLESFDIRGCYYPCLDSKLEKLCREQIKDFKYMRDNILERYEDSDVEFAINGTDDDDDDGVSGGSDVSAGDDYD